MSRFSVKPIMVLAGAFGLLVVEMSIGSGSRANEASIQQIGDGNGAANIDFGIANEQSIAQVGSRNAALQLAGPTAGNNRVGTAQLGDRNAAITTVTGSNNVVGTLQIGFDHVARTTVHASDADVGVVQIGRGRVSDLTVVDRLPAGARSSNGVVGVNAGGRMQVGVFQGPGAAPVNAYVGRDTVGNLVVRPGNATLVMPIVGSNG